MCSQLDGHMFSPGWNPKSSRCHAHKLHGHDQLGHAATWRGTLLATLFAAGAIQQLLHQALSVSQRFSRKVGVQLQPSSVWLVLGRHGATVPIEPARTWPYLAGKRCMRKFLAYLFLPDATHPLRTPRSMTTPGSAAPVSHASGIIHPLLSIELSLAHGQQRLEEIFDDNRWWAGGGRLQDVSVHHHHHLRRLARPESTPEDAVDVGGSPDTLVCGICIFPPVRNSFLVSR